MKGDRQEEVLRIIEDQVITTQDDLQNALISLGYSVTQSTVSRDIKQLKLIKGHDKNGVYRYLNGNVGIANENAVQHYNDLINRSVTDVRYAVNDVIIKCYTGMAQSVCVAIDNIFRDDMVGSVAGDNTILVITKDEKTAEELALKIRKLL